MANRQRNIEASSTNAGADGEMEDGDVGSQPLFDDYDMYDIQPGQQRSSETFNHGHNDSSPNRTLHQLSQ